MDLWLGSMEGPRTHLGPPWTAHASQLERRSLRGHHGQKWILPSTPTHVDITQAVWDRMELGSPRFPTDKGLLHKIKGVMRGLYVTWFPGRSVTPPLQTTAHQDCTMERRLRTRFALGARCALRTPHRQNLGSMNWTRSLDVL